MTFAASAKQRVLLTLGALGRGLQQVASGNVEVRLSTDAGQSLAFGTDGGVIVTASAIANAALPTVAASDNGKVLTVQGGAWGKQLPTALDLLGTTVYTASTAQVNLQAVLAALPYASSVKAFSIQCVGGGASGRSGGSYGGQGGMPGMVDETPLYPIANIAALTSVDIAVGAGGAGYSTTTNYSFNNYGTLSSVALHASGAQLVLGDGGRTNYGSSSASWWSVFCGTTIGTSDFVARYIPSLSQRDHLGGAGPNSGTTGGYGPGAGGTASYNTSATFGAGGMGHGDAEIVGGAYGSIYTAPAATVSAAGAPAATDRTFGSGGNGGNSQGSPTGGKGGFPGGGGGGSYSANASGAGAAGVVRIHWWG